MYENRGKFLFQTTANGNEVRRENKDVENG